MASALRCCAVLAAVGACGSDASDKPEVVIADASLGGAMPVVLGATSTTVFWSASSGGSTTVGAGSLASLPAHGSQIVTASDAAAPAGDYVFFAADGTISRVDSAGVVQRITVGAPDAIAGSSAPVPVLAWSVGAVVSWGPDDAQKSATLIKVDSCDHARVTAQQIYIACDGATGRRLLRIDQASGAITPITPSSTWAPMFPGGGMAGSTYRGRIAGGDDDGVLWLVEEMPSKRAILVLEPMQGEPSVLLEHITGATGFFATDTALYWQEGDALLTAPRTGGSASIAVETLGVAGAVADGYVYFTDGAAIERLRVE